MKAPRDQHFLVDPRAIKRIADIVDALVAQTRAIEKAVIVLDLGDVAFEGSDSLDAPHKVR